MSGFKHVILIGAFILAACTGEREGSITTVRDPIIADRTLKQQSILVAPDTGKPTEAGLDGLDRFFFREAVGYGDRISVAGGNAKARKAVARHLYRNGYFRVRDAGRGADGDALHVVLSRITLTAPSCGDWSDSVAPDHANLPPRNHGCANRSNLARMIADPHDLFEPDAGPFAADSARQATTIDALRGHRLEIGLSSTEATTTGD